MSKRRWPWILAFAMLINALSLAPVIDRLIIATLTANEWSLIAWSNALAFFVGAVYIACAIKQTHILVHIVFGSPCASAFVLASYLFGGVLVSGIRAGTDFGSTIAEGLAAAVLYGFGAGLYATPGAILGGITAWLILRSFAKA